MRKIVLSLIASAAALAAAAPAAAQYYPGAPAGPPAYGERGDWGGVRGLEMRIDNVRRQIDRLDRRDAIRGRAADRLMNEANWIDRRLHDHARNGLNPREVGDIEYRIQRLEQRVHFAVNDRDGRYVNRW